MSMSSELTSVIQQACGPQHTATVFFLHGLGDSGEGWAPAADQIRKAMPHVKFILPNAPVRPITINGGYHMPGWFDIFELGHLERMLGAGEDEAGILNSMTSISRLIRDEVNSGIPAQRIVVGGFSQGCAIALATSLTSEYKFAGIIGLSGFVPSRNKILSMAADANKTTPIFLAHGNADEVIPFEIGKMTSELLTSKGYNVTFKSYPRLGHTFGTAEARDMTAFLQQVIPY
ncbi:5156_t:CDS:2 [Paraglomus brasilianum]|uniref:Acyl-protein thioesterase 1 n=1 Tax=Paraglomus brasilianum TaxID=144538 RepID=A0A9N9CBX3_9GLOM|nr:5156_t:CDS:2 [Paraglomus brasilianum]